jgi:hypothetical protein
MAVLDEDDDSVDRWTVYRYRFDPERGHGRYMPSITVTDEAEAERYLDEAARELAADREAGRAGRKDVVSASHFPAGYRAAMRAKRLNDPAKMTAYRVDPDPRDA